MQVKVRNKCAVCNGDGYLAYRGNCSFCVGTGYITDWVDIEKFKEKLIGTNT